MVDGAEGEKHACMHLEAAWFYRKSLPNTLLLVKFFVSICCSKNNRAKVGSPPASYWLESRGRTSTRGSARGFIRALRVALPKLRGAPPKALHEALHEALLEALPEALSKAPSELRTKLCQDSA